jgi:hypothetical protein
MAHPVIAGLLVIVLGFPALATGQSPTTKTVSDQPSAAAVLGATPGAQTATTEPQIIMALVDPDEKVVAWRSLRLQLSIINGSHPSGIGIKSFRLSIPPSIGMGVVGMKSRSDGAVNLMPTAIDIRSPGERLDLTPVELKGRSITELRGQFLSLLTYSPRKEVFVTTLEYEGLADRITHTKTEKLEVKVAAHPLGMYAGAVLGALLVSIFTLLPRPTNPPKSPTAKAGEKVDPPPQPPSPPLSIRARNALMRFIRGSLATGIAILIFQTASDVNFAVSVTVHDFYGGALLGFFGDKVAVTIYKRFF